MGLNNGGSLTEQQNLWERTGCKSGRFIKPKNNLDRQRCIEISPLQQNSDAAQF